MSHSGGGFSSSGSFGPQGALSAASTLMSAVGSSGHAQGTTQAAVSEGTITVRDTAHSQDAGGLQRDVTQANDAISPIFNKEKEQNRLQAVQMVSDIGNQVADIVRTQSDLDGLKAAIAQTGTSLQGLPEKERLAKLAALRDTAVYKKVTENTGTGSDVQRAITAATAAVSGLAGGNLNAALAGAAAPYIASEIGKNITDQNTTAGIMAHAVVNAVLAKVQGQDALAGASGAVVGESMGILLAKQVYGKSPAALTDTEKQTIAALSTLASGLAGALAGNSTEATATAAKAGQTTVENNFLGEDSRKRKDALVHKGLTEGLAEDEEKDLIFLDKTNQLSDEYLDKYRHDPGSLTPDEKYVLNQALNAFVQENSKYYDADTVNKMVGSLFSEGATFKDYGFPFAASSELKNKITDNNKAGLGFWDALTYTRDISPQERLYKDAISDLGAVNEHAYWGRVGEPVLNFLPSAPGLVVNVKDAITGGSQMGQATASFLNDGPNADSAGRFLEGFLNAAGAVAGTHWGYKSGYAGNELVDSGIVSPGNYLWQESTLVKKPFYDKPQEGGILNIGAGNRPIEGAYNISHPDYPKGPGVYAGDANDLSNIATGSQTKIIMENPYGFEPFNDEVVRVLDQNGTIIVKGTWNNPTIRKIEREAKKYGFTLTERNVIPSTGFSQTDGKPIANKTVTEYKFKRSGHK
ncbi:VENN motif pre-toxin domain-containing protein [Cronobacter turicensis]